MLTLPTYILEESRQHFDLLCTKSLHDDTEIHINWTLDFYLKDIVIVTIVDSKMVGRRKLYLYYHGNILLLRLGSAQSHWQTVSILSV